MVTATGDRRDCASVLTGDTFSSMVMFLSMIVLDGVN